MNFQAFRDWKKISGIHFLAGYLEKKLPEFCWIMMVLDVLEIPAVVANVPWLDVNPPCIDKRDFWLPSIHLGLPYKD